MVNGIAELGVPTKQTNIAVQKNAFDLRILAPRLLNAPVQVGVPDSSPAKVDIVVKTGKPRSEQIESVCSRPVSYPGTQPHLGRMTRKGSRQTGTWLFGRERSPDGQIRLRQNSPVTDHTAGADRG